MACGEGPRLHLPTLTAGCPMGSQLSGSASPSVRVPDGERGGYLGAAESAAPCDGPDGERPVRETANRPQLRGSLGNEHVTFTALAGDNL